MLLLLLMLMLLLNFDMAPSLFLRIKQEHEQEKYGRSLKNDAYAQLLICNSPSSCLIWRDSQHGLEVPIRAHPVAQWKKTSAQRDRHALVP